MDSVESEIYRYSALYKDNRAGWHQKDVNQILLRHISVFPKNVAGLSPKSVFVPLCGKSKDIPYLLSLGYRVFGVEAVEQAILELQAENSLQLEHDEVENIYATSDNSLVIYCGNIFNCPIEKWGPFDCIWDRGSFSVFPEEIRSEYVKVIRRAIKGVAESRYLLEVYDYDKKLSEMPPRAGNREDIQKVFGPWFQIQELESSPATSAFLKHFEFLKGIPCYQKTYILTSKQ